MSLQLYLKLLEMPDLCARLDPEDVEPGITVDLVPPHKDGNTNEIKSAAFGKSHDLMTRGAVATVLL